MPLKCFLPEFVISIQSRQTANQNGYLKKCNKRLYWRKLWEKKMVVCLQLRKRFRKPFYKAAGVNLPVWVSKTLAQKSELDITSTTAIRTLTVRKTKRMSHEAAIEGKFMGDCDLHCATCTCRLLSVSLIEWLFRF